MSTRSALNRPNWRGANHQSSAAKPPSYYILPTERDPMLTVGMNQPPLQILKVPQAIPSDWMAVQPRSLTPIASYNWTNSSTPTILVPGCPPIWQNKPTPFKVPRDSGRNFVDQNRFRMPQYPLLPLFVAIEHMRPSFDYPSLDIVTDRNNIRKLLRWIEGTSNKDFRVDLQLCGEKTVVLGRWESNPVEMNPQNLGFGLNFEKYTTRLLAGCENSTGHHRIVSYDYGGLKMLVRFEVDACSLYDAQTQTLTKHKDQFTTNHGPDDDELAVAMAELSLLSISPTQGEYSEAPETDVNDTGPDICVIPTGQFVPQSTLIELTTKSIKYINPFPPLTYGGRGRGGGRNIEEPVPDWGLFFPQLYLSGTPHHKFAVHERGQFKRVYERTLRDEELRQHLRTQQRAFNKLRVLLGRIIEIVKEKGQDARLSLVYKLDEKRMELYERVPGRGCLPKVWLKKFEPSPSPDVKDDVEEDVTQKGKTASETEKNASTEVSDTPVRGARQDPLRPPSSNDSKIATPTDSSASDNYEEGKAQNTDESIKRETIIDKAVECDDSPEVT